MQGTGTGRLQIGIHAHHVGVPTVCPPPKKYIEVYKSPSPSPVSLSLFFGGGCFFWAARTLNRMRKKAPDGWRRAPLPGWEGGGVARVLGGQWAAMPHFEQFEIGLTSRGSKSAFLRTVRRIMFRPIATAMPGTHIPLSLA